MKRRRLVREITTAAKSQGVTFELVEQGAEHEKWRCGSELVVIPRHTEVNDRTALRIRQQLQGVLGKG